MRGKKKRKLTFAEKRRLREFAVWVKQEIEVEETALMQEAWNEGVKKEYQK